MADTSAADRLSMQIGRAAQHHVQLDLALRTVHQSLCSPGLGTYLNAQIDSTRRLADECKTMLANAAVPDGVKAGGAAALGAAIDANELRNRVIHDMWTVPAEPTSGQPFERMKRLRKGLGNQFESSRADIGYVERAVDQLRRAHFQLSALNFALWETLPFFQGSSTGSDLERHIKFMLGEFKLTADGGAALTEG